MSYSDTLGLLYSACNSCSSYLGSAIQSASQAQSSLASASNTARRASGAVSTAHRAVQTAASQCRNFKKLLEQYVQSVQDFDQSFAAAFGKEPLSAPLVSSQMTDAMKMAYASYLISQMLLEGNQEIKKELAEQAAQVIAALTPGIKVAETAKVLSVPLVLGDITGKFDVNVKVNTESTDSLAALQATIQSQLISLSVAAGESNFVAAVDKDSLRLGVEIDNVTVRFDLMKLSAGLANIQLTTAQKADNFSVSASLELVKPMDKPQPQLEPVPVEDFSAVPEQIEESWWEKGWDILTDAGNTIAEGISNVGSWISEHPAETALIVVAAAAIILIPFTGGTSALFVLA